MAVTVTPNLTDLVDCDVLTGNPVTGTFSASQGSPAVVTDIYREATGSIGVELRSAGVQYLKFTRTSGTWDLSNTHIYIWFQNLFFNALETKTNGGIRILVGDGTNVGYWYVGGKDTYSGGWVCLVVDTSKTLDSGSCTLTAVTEVGIGVNYASAVRNVESTYMDIARYGDGITVTSDATCTLQDIYDYSSADTDGRAHGIVRKEGGVFYVQGKIRFGDASSGSITFEDTSQIVIFEDKDVNANLYEILIQGNATGSTSVKFGTKSGNKGISGFVFKAVGTPKFDFTATDADIDTLGLYGCTFIDADTISLPAYNTNKEVLSCNLEASNEILADNCIMEYVAIISPDDRGIRLNDVDPNVKFKNSNIINAPDGIHINVAGTYTLDNVKFSGCTKDIENSTAGTVVIKNTNGSNASTSEETGGGSTSIETTVYLKVYVKDEDGNNIQNAQVAIFKQNDMTQLMNEDTDANGYAEETFNYGGGPDVDIYLRIRKSTTGTTRYVPISTLGKITSDGFTYYAVLIEDDIALP